MPHLAEELSVLAASSDDYCGVQAFLFEEAALLDARLHHRWLELLTDDVTYRMPVRATMAKDIRASVLADMDHFAEDRYSLEKRVSRFDTEHAWTEDPPSRTRRFVSNIRVFAGETSDELRVVSYLLLFRSRGDIAPPDLLSCERHDVFRRSDAVLRLAAREVLVDESVLRTQNLAIFL
jgi:3-phenylpropionate/cinnamic acid dioxygenase small subunit